MTFDDRGAQRYDLDLILGFAGQFAAMKSLIRTFFVTLVLPLAAWSSDMPVPGPFPVERLGIVSFPVSCSPQVRQPFNRAVALLHDFWYEEAQSEFGRIVKADPHCAMAHWGVAMSVWHQIWDRPDEHGIARAQAEMRAAQRLNAGTARERAYIKALGDFFRRGKRGYQPPWAISISAIRTTPMQPRSMRCRCSRRSRRPTPA